MNIHEYQGAALLRKAGVGVPDGDVATNGTDARAIAQKLGGDRWVIKAQIHAGGRGKGGGVKFANSLDEVVSITDAMIGMTLVTHQTGPAGKIVHQVYVQKPHPIAHEFYMSLGIDRISSQIGFIVSKEGGMNIEDVAKERPDALLVVHIDPVMGYQPFHGRQIANFLGLTGETYKECLKYCASLYECFVQNDASIIEMNPLVLTNDGHLMALDAKVGFDDNALFRHPNIVELRDLREEDPMEIEASRHELNYVKLDGNIGCMVNGAGLAMATMDIIKLYGGNPANFLDVGGGATKERVTAAFKIILSDPSVKGVLVNIFGGIMRCDIIAQGIVDAVKEVNIKVPLVVRLEGTNVNEGKAILSQSGLAVVNAEGFEDGAKKIVSLVEGAS